MVFQSTYAQRLTESVLGIKTEEIPASAFTAAKTVLLDTAGCALAGRKAPGLDAVGRLMRDWGGKPEAGLFFESTRLPMPNAAFVNSAMIHALDYDDNYTPGTLHTTSVIVPAVFAASGAASANGRQALAAMILGIETAARIALAERSRRRSGGFLPTSLAGGFGAVAAAARLLGLTPEQTTQAMGINYAQISGNRQALLDASLTKRLQPAFAARSALWAVALAQSGVTGPSRVFEGEAGYFKLYLNGDVPDIEEFMRPLDAFAVERISAKPYPSCGCCHMTQIAAERLRAEEHLTAADIAGVEVFGVPALVSQPFRAGDNPQVSAQFSAAWAVAHSLLRGRARLHDYADESVRRDTEVCALAAAVKHVPAPADLPPPPPPHPLHETCGAGYRTAWQGVIVITRDGRRLMRLQAPSQTYVPQPPPWPEAERKFQECASFARLAPEAAREMLNAIENAETATFAETLLAGDKTFGPGA